MEIALTIYAVGVLVMCTEAKDGYQFTLGLAWPLILLFDLLHELLDRYETIIRLRDKDD